LIAKVQFLFHKTEKSTLANNLKEMNKTV